tara:strand:- start:829 stop:1392 length:564 start_codon:yes stop_codon:yes gene_type:complete
MFKNLELFQTNVYFSILKNIDNEKIKKYISKIKLEEHGIFTSNSSGYHSQIFFDPFPSCVDTLHKVIKKKLLKVRKDFKCRGELFPHSSWFMINKKNDFNKPYKHPPYTFKGMYYIECPKNSGDIVFNNQMEMNNYNMAYESLNKFNCKDFTVTPEKNLLLIFPAWLEYYITPNKTNKDMVFYNFVI